METIRAFVATLLMIALILPTAHAAGPEDTGKAHELIVSVGVGAEIDTTLRRGERIAGTVQEIKDDRFVVLKRDGKRKSIRYRDVRQIGSVIIEPPPRSGRARALDLFIVAMVAIAGVVHLRECWDQSC